MTEQYKKAQYFLAKYQALSNAAEMIRSHGEEGFSFEDKVFNKEYLRQTKKTAEQLDKRAKLFAVLQQVINTYDLEGFDGIRTLWRQVKHEISLL